MNNKMSEEELSTQEHPRKLSFLEEVQSRLQELQVNATVGMVAGVLAQEVDRPYHGNPALYAVSAIMVTTALLTRPLVERLRLEDPTKAIKNNFWNIGGILAGFYPAYAFFS